MADVGSGVEMSVADKVDFGQNMYPRTVKLMMITVQNIHHHPGFDHILGADGVTTHGPDRFFKS
jgi:hypothetical protein